MPCTSEIIGKAPSGAEIYLFTLENQSGAILKAMSYGGIITELHVPDRLGGKRDVVLGCENLRGYLDGHPWFGAITGRVAGRITHGKFSLEGVDYEMEINDPPNHLHGGSQALDKKVWKGAPAETPQGEPKVIFSYLSPEGEEGYPGNVDLKVSYTLTDENALVIDYEATTDRATPLCLTNHAYFNLTGDGSGPVDDHYMELNCHEYVPTDDELTLSGRIESVSGRGNDFTKARRLGDAFPGLLRQHGDNYMIPSAPDGGLSQVARVYSTASGIVMNVRSNDRCVQFYTGRFLDEKTWVGKSGQAYGVHDGFCLECQGYPDGVHSPEIDDIILRPNETYRRQTVYAFSVSDG